MIDITALTRLKPSRRRTSLGRSSLTGMPYSRRNWTKASPWYISS